MFDDAVEITVDEQVGGPSRHRLPPRESALHDLVGIV